MAEVCLVCKRKATWVVRLPLKDGTTNLVYLCGYHRFYGGRHRPASRLVESHVARKE